MKKILLSLAMLVFGISAYSQNTYIKDDVIVKVNKNTLFFHGGNVEVITPADNKTDRIINEGNIEINGSYKNGSNGKNFVNKYIDGNNSFHYGQLIIKGNEAETTGKVTMERNIPYTDNSNSYYNFGIPFKTETTAQIFTAIQANIFNNTSTRRYDHTALVWNVSQTAYDNIATDKVNLPGYNYLVNVQNLGGTNEFLKYIKSITSENGNIKPVLKLTGTPTVGFVFNQKSGIRNLSESDFSGQAWNDWKNLTNVYGETYNSYLGLGISTNTRIFGKNLFRFSNPFTSNLDLTDMNKTTSWIKINNLGPTEVFTNVARFRLNKIPNNLTIIWNQSSGSQNSVPNGDKRISAFLEPANGKYFWAGDPDALIVKPFEYFEVQFYAINTGNNGNSNLINANFNIGNNQKTFKNEFINTGSPTNGIYERGTNSVNIKNLILNNSDLKEKGFIAPNDFNQLSIYLIQNNQLVDPAVFLANASFYKTNSSESSNEEPNNIFLYEEHVDGKVLTNNQTDFNSFNNDFVGKPLGLGFKNLTDGETYSLKFKLHQFSILNPVNNFENGIFYLYDKMTKKATEIDANTEIKFTKTANIADRYVFYWNEVPKELIVDNIEIKNTDTFVYDKSNKKFVRFERNDTNALIKIFNLTGQNIATYENISTLQDFDLKLINIPAVYIVNITYDDGKTVSKKVVQN